MSGESREEFERDRFGTAGPTTSQPSSEPRGEGQFPVNKEWGHDKLVNVLEGAAGLLDVIKGEWGEAWSAWDQSVRNGLTQQLMAHAAKRQGEGLDALDIAKKWLQHAHSEENCETVAPMAMGAACHFIGDDDGDVKCLAATLERFAAREPSGEVRRLDAPVELQTMNVMLIRARLEEAAHWHSAHLLRDKGPLAFGCDLFQERDDCRYVVALRSKLERALSAAAGAETGEETKE